MYNKKYLNKYHKLSDKHLECLSEVTTDLLGTKLTVKDMKQRFEEKLMNKVDVSESTIKRKINDLLKLRY